MTRLPGDYCRCAGQDCDRKETCLRFTAWRDKQGPMFISLSARLCHWAEDKAHADFYIRVGGSEPENS